MSVIVALDEAALLERLGHNRQLLTNLVRIFLEEGPRILQRIADGIARNDPSAVRLASHTLKGSLSYFAVDSAIELADSIERQAKAGCFDTVVSAFAELEEVTQSLLADLQRLRR
jgi:HPt (histidine-containing phosphotransfer) domain-containing protein